MGYGKNVICRLCLTPCNNEFETIQEITREILDVLALQLNLKISEKPVICKYCSEVLLELFEFKSACLYTHDRIHPYITDTNYSKLDINEIYISENKRIGVSRIGKDQVVCCFCMKLVETDDCVPFNSYVDDPSKSVMFEQYFSELNMNVTSDPIICSSCRESLKKHFSFITYYLDVEEKLHTFCEVKGTNSRNQIRLSNVLSWFLNTGIQREDFSISIEGIKEENSKAQIKDDKSLVKIEIHNLSIKEEIDVETSQTDLYRFQSENQLATKREGFTKTAVHSCSKCTYTSTKIIDLVRHRLIHRTILQCTECTYATRRVNNLKRHKLIHEKASRKPQIQCTECKYSTGYKSHWKRHILIHQDKEPKYKCDICSFSADKKKIFDSHVLIHPDGPKLKIYECEVCRFKTRHRHYLRMHVELHKSTPDLKIYKCADCDFKTAFRGNLTQHLWHHKNPSDLIMHQCDLCDYKSKFKESVRKHMVIHKVATFQCDVCKFETKHKSNLVAHMRVHSNESELKMYQCQTCEFKTKHRMNLKRHMKLHKDASEVTT